MLMANATSIVLPFLSSICFVLQVRVEGVEVGVEHGVEGVGMGWRVT